MSLMARFFEAQSSLEGPKSAEALAQSGVQAVDDVTVNLDQREEPEEDADADWQPSSGFKSAEVLFSVIARGTIWSKEHQCGHFGHSGGTTVITPWWTRECQAALENPGNLLGRADYADAKKAFQAKLHKARMGVMSR